jgi:hypothetical protein
VTAAGDDPADRYEQAEAAYLDRVRKGSVSDLGEAATSVAEAAKAWQTAAYARYFETKAALGEASGGAVQDEITAEKAELLAELWSDIADAHRDAEVRR